MISKKLIAAAGNAGAGGALYVEDVFSTYLYTGNGTSQTITNGIDLSGEGGLTWIKNRSASENHYLWDTERGNDSLLFSNLNNGELTGQSSYFTFNADGFSLPTVSYNNSSVKYASWTFRKAEKFFDVVTFTAPSSGAATVSHNLGSVPACIIIKATALTGFWYVYHESVSTKYLQLQSSAAATSLQAFTNVTDSSFDVAGGLLPANATYVAYLFASDAGGFGDDGSESIIKCGSYVGDGTSDHSIEVGFEPQWLLIKNTSSARDWVLSDSMRGLNLSQDYILRPNTSASEVNFAVTEVTSTGFRLTDGDDKFNSSGDNFIYIAIRRPMKTPESGTEVFALQDPGYPVDSNGLAFTSGFPVDMAMLKERTSTDPNRVLSRLTGKGNYLETTDFDAESSGITYGTFDHNTGWYSTASASMSWMFKRAPGFFDMVAYTGTGTAHAETHNLGVVPELLIVKNRSGIRNWFVWVNGFGSTDYLELNLTSQKQTGANIWNSTVPTDTQFSVGGVNNTSSIEWSEVPSPT